MKKVEQLLLKKQDLEYKEFISKLTPTLNKDYFIGVRVPEIKTILKELSEKDKEEVLKELPHKYYEMNLLHAFIIQKIKDYDVALIEVEKFLPYVNAWAVSDTMLPVSFKKNRDDVYKHILKWIKSKETYTIRFAVDMLMTHFLDEGFKKEYLEIPAKIKSDEYYVNMMIAWFYATALTKQYDETIKIIKSKTLSKWIQNKSIQKAIESYRIDDKKKDYLRTLKIDK